MSQRTEGYRLAAHQTIAVAIESGVSFQLAVQVDRKLEAYATYYSSDANTLFANNDFEAQILEGPCERIL